METTLFEASFNPFIDDDGRSLIISTFDEYDGFEDTDDNFVFVATGEHIDKARKQLALALASDYIDGWQEL